MSAYLRIPPVPRVDPDDPPQVEYREFIEHGQCEHCFARGLVKIRERIEGNCITVESELCRRCDEQ